MDLFFLAECQDRWNDYAKVKSVGRCRNNEKAMSYFYKQTCGFCEMNNHIQTSRSQPRVQRRYTPNPSAKQNNANTCADKSENCKALVEYGWCQMRKAYMENLCSEACGFVITIIIEAQILWDGCAHYDCNHG